MKQQNICKTITAGTDTLLVMARQLMDRGEISIEQYAKMQRQNLTFPQEVRKDVIAFTLK